MHIKRLRIRRYRGIESREWNPCPHVNCPIGPDSPVRGVYAGWAYAVLCAPCAPVAQLVEQMTVNHRVVGSSPTAGANKNKALAETGWGLVSCGSGRANAGQTKRTTAASGRQGIPTNPTPGEVPQAALNSGAHAKRKPRPKAGPGSCTHKRELGQPRGADVGFYDANTGRKSAHSGASAWCRGC